MLEAVALSAVLLAGVDDRQVALQQPSRGGHASAVREAGTPPPKWSAWARCVLRRETGAVLHNRQSREDARNGSSSAAGRWQMLRAWESGLPWLVQRRLVKFGMPKAEAKRVRVYLTGRPISKIDGWYQDIAAMQVVEEGGWRHWSGGKGCNSLVPAGAR